MTAQATRAALAQVLRQHPPAEPRPNIVYVLEEREAGIARAHRHLTEGRPVMMLAALIATVQAQARIDGIGGVTIPFRPNQVTRPVRWEMRLRGGGEGR